MPYVQLIQSWIYAFLLTTAIVGCGDDSGGALKNAASMEASGDYLGAIETLKPAMSAQPTNGVIRFQIGRLYLALFDGAAAEHEFRKAIELGTFEGGRVVLGLARALSLQRKYQEIVQSVDPAPAFEPQVLASIHAVRGETYLILDQIERADHEREAARSLDKENADLALLEAQRYAAQRKLAESLSAVEGGLAKDAKNTSALRHKANLFASQGKIADAVSVYDEILQVHPRHRDALVGRAICNIVRDRMSDAQVDIDVLRQTYSQHPVTGAVLGQYHYWSRSYREALDWAQRALKVDQDARDARLLSAMANLALGAPVRAEQDFVRYLAQVPWATSARRVLSEIRAELARDGPAVQALASILNGELRSAVIQSAVGDIYASASQAPSLAHWLERFVADRPLDLLVAARYIEKRISVDQVERAASDLDRVARLSKSLVPADTALVVARLAQRDTTKADEAVSRVAGKSTAGSEGPYLAAVVAMFKNQHTDAIRGFESALQRDDKFVPAAVNLSQFDLAAGKRDVARSRFSEILRTDPNNLQALMAAASIEELTGRRKEALELLNHALRTHRQSVEPRILLFNILNRNRDQQGMRTLADDTLEAAPENVVALELVAEIKASVGEPFESLGHYERAAHKAPRSPESRYRLAHAQYIAGKKIEASASLGKAIDMRYDDTDLPSSASAAVLMGALKTLEAIDVSAKSYRPAARQAGKPMQGDTALWGPGTSGAMGMSQ